VFIIPFLFIVFQSLQERMTGKPKEPLTENRTNNTQPFNPPA
jgi:hypothetical protein